MLPGTLVPLHLSVWARGASPWSFFLSCIPTGSLGCVAQSSISITTHALLASHVLLPRSLFLVWQHMCRQNRHWGVLACGRRKVAREESPIGFDLPSGWIWPRDVSKKCLLWPVSASSLSLYTFLINLSKRLWGCAFIYLSCRLVVFVFFPTTFRVMGPAFFFFFDFKIPYEKASFDWELRSILQGVCVCYRE